MAASCSWVLQGEGPGLRRAGGRRSQNTTNHPASSDQPASGASAPCRVKRRNVKAVARAGPASGTETDTASAAYAVASIGRIPTLAPPAASSLRSMIAKAAMDAISSRRPAGIQSQCR